MKIVVTGSGGFVGSRLVEALRADGHEVCGIELGDDMKGVLSCFSPVDVFCHLAWNGVRGAARADYALQLENVRVALESYDRACEYGVKRFVCAGTIGELMAERADCESLKSQNFTYVAAKGFLRRLLAGREANGCKVVWARLGNLYGHGLHGNLVDFALRRIASGEHAEFGPAKQPYDFVHVKDAVRGLAILCTAGSVSNSAYYIGSGRCDRLEEWLHEIGRVAGKPDLISIGVRPDDGTRYEREWFSISGMRSLGYAPAIPFSSGVAELIEESK